MAAPGEDCHCSYFQSFTWRVFTESLLSCHGRYISVIDHHTFPSVNPRYQWISNRDYSDILPMILELNDITWYIKVTLTLTLTSSVVHAYIFHDQSINSILVCITHTYTQPIDRLMIVVVGIKCPIYTVYIPNSTYTIQSMYVIPNGANPVSVY